MLDPLNSFIPFRDKKDGSIRWVAQDKTKVDDNIDLMKAYMSFRRSLLIYSGVQGIKDEKDNLINFTYMYDTDCEAVEAATKKGASICVKQVTKESGFPNYNEFKNLDSVSAWSFSVQ